MEAVVMGSRDHTVHATNLSLNPRQDYPNELLNAATLPM
jgi:hypothetical protein